MNQKDLPKSTHTQKSTTLFFFWKSVFLLQQKQRGYFPWGTYNLCPVVICDLPESASTWCVPRSGQHMLRVCTSCAGYTKSGNSFSLFISFLWRSGALGDSDYGKVFFSRCEVPHLRQWTSFVWGKARSSCMWHMGWRDELEIIAWHTDWIAVTKAGTSSVTLPFDTWDLQPDEKSKRLTQSEVSSWVWRGFWGA